MRYLLNLIYLAVLSVILICAIHPRYRRRDVLGGFWQKFLGLVPRLVETRPVVWFHAACVGEAQVCGPVIRRLQRLRPDVRFVLSVFSVDGLQTARQEYPDLTVFFAPYDFTWSVNRAFRRIQPALVIIAENDLWPNFIAAAGRRRIPCAAFNTRISPRELREHAWNGWLISPSLSAIRWWGVVDRQAADGILKYFGVGSPPVEICGLLKFDGEIRQRRSTHLRDLRTRLGFSADDRILLAGSTHPGEEELILKAYLNMRRLFPKIRLMIAPRNVGRCAEIQTLANSLNVSMHCPTEGVQLNTCLAPAILVDTVGQLREFWGIADFAFVGGTLSPIGGQNMAEPASYGIPVCFGPSYFNFQSLADDLIANRGAFIIHSQEDLEELIIGWLRNPAEADAIGATAQSLLGRHLKPLETTVERLAALIPTTTL